MFASLARLMHAYQNNDTYLEESDGSITDLVRLKSGAAMAFAVAAGIYQELGQVSKQENIDVHALAGVVQRLLDSMPKNAKADVEQVSCIYRASLKLDAYPTEKLHGLPEDL
jgi:type I site-specific restriction endonuclease